MPQKPTSTDVLKILAIHHQKTLPGMVKEIETCHASNIKDRLKDLHRVVSALVAYLLIKETEAPDPEVQKIVQGVVTPEVAREIALQDQRRGVPAGGPRTTRNVIVGTELPIPGEANLPQGIAEEADPEATTRVQIITRRNGSVVVIPPLGSKAPKRTFAVGEGVDATYITEFDSQPDGE